MNFDLDPTVETFRQEVRSFIEDCADQIRTVWPISRSQYSKVAEILNSKGWLAPHWPIEWGGCALLSAVQRYVLKEELVKFRVDAIDGIALDLAGPVIHTFGTKDQKQRYLPKILNGTELWCQGFSEPESGSDVNSLRTSASREGNYYVIEGGKIWVSNAHMADMMFALVKIKIGGKLQNGITFILIDMHDPNVVVRPITTIDGGHHINEVSLNGVRVPVANVVGEPGRGWHNARFLLANERVMVSQAPRTRQRLNRLNQWLSSSINCENKLWGDVEFKRRIALAEIDLSALEFAVLRVLHSPQDDPALDGLTNVLKLRGSELRQRVGELAYDALGSKGLMLTDNSSYESGLEPEHHVQLVVREHLFDLSATIAGGTSEIQRNLIAAVTLGL